MSARIAITAGQVPFSSGGAELLVSSLAERLEGRGFEVDVLSIPFVWHTREQLLTSTLAWRMLDLGESGGRPIDLIIATKFPTYTVRHVNKVVWLVHQFRQVYELQGTPYSDFGALPNDPEVIERIHDIDRRALKEARRVFTISQNVANRLERYLGLQGEALYPPPALADYLKEGNFGDYILSVGRLNELKRVDRLVDAIAACNNGVRCKIVGKGEEEASLRQMVDRLGIQEQVEFVGEASDQQLVELYSGALGVYYAPFDEDYGYVTIEAMRSGKPVLTMADSGGVLEFVRDQENGAIVGANDKRGLARQMDAWKADTSLARRLGSAGRQTVEEITWNQVLDRLTETL